MLNKKKISFHPCPLVSVCVCVLLDQCVWLHVTPWTVAHQASLSMEFFRQEYWNGLPFLSLGYLEKVLEPKSRGSTDNYLCLWGSLSCRYVYWAHTQLSFVGFTLLPLILFYFTLFYLLIFISWRLITLQYFSGSCHTLTWISHGYTCIPHPDHPSHLPLHPIPLGLPSAPGPSTCLMHPTWAGDLFHPR